jgi:superfamily II DNA/RNA helicase
VRGADARTGNPFVGPDSDRIIVSVDTLAGERMFARMREAVVSGTALPYDLVVFDEAHKLAADREQDFYVRKTDRYRLAEALAGFPAESPRWELGWSATNILLLTATPHMGKDFPYYCLWRLLAPDALATFEAFQRFPESQRRRYFIRRTKEEMVRFDGRPLYPQRQCDTLSYDLSSAEQQLYDATTKYITETYNKARVLNRAAARLAMSVFQRRQASSTYALMRSFERRLERLDEAIELVRAGRAEELERRQKRIGDTPDFFETRTADEDADDSGERERHEEFEDNALGGLVALTLMDLQEERAEVEALLSQARRIADASEDSKFEKLRVVLRDPSFAREKFIIFTEHRDTAEFLVRRLEGLGFTGQVALIHGGLDYREREAQVELFRRPLDEGGANYLVATDAAGEGINLQFCWLMVNYDVPWNPARLEQRMGRIHRYGQKRDPVIIVNLIAGETREGRVLKTLLDKLELIRDQLRSDKVFDVVGRLFENVSFKTYLEMATTEDGARAAIEGIGGLLTEEQVRALQDRERALFGGGDVKSHLKELNAAIEQEQYRRLLPGYVRRFVEGATPLIDLRLEAPRRAVVDVLGDLRRYLPRKIGANAGEERRRNHGARLQDITRCRRREAIGAHRAAIDGRVDEGELAILHVLDGVRIDGGRFAARDDRRRRNAVRTRRRKRVRGGARMRIGRREEFGRARRLPLLADALLLRIDGGGRREMPLRREDRPAEIAGERRAELRDVLWQARIVARQSGEAVGGGSDFGVVELRRLPRAPALLQGVEGHAENGGGGDARKRDQRAARKARHRRALGPQAQLPGEFLLALRRAHIDGLPSLRIMRTILCESAPKRSSAAAKSRSTIIWLA